MAAPEKKHSQAAKSLLLANLGFFDSEIPNELDIYLHSLLDYVFDDFVRMGITLVPGVIKDDMDQAIHAAWMYRNGVTGNGKSEMLKAIIRNRQVSSALKEDA